jgi:general secretion pathway protein H
MISFPMAPTEHREERVIIEISLAGKDEKGFSLLELLAVLLLIGLASLVVLPSIDKGLRGNEIRQSALEIAALARSLRRQAVYGNTLRQLILNAAEKSIQEGEGKKLLLPSATKIVALEGGESVGDGLLQFLFFPNGSILGGSISISGEEGTPVYQVRLDSLTGQVTVLRAHQQ